MPCFPLPRTVLVRGMLLKQVVRVVDLSTHLPLERVDSSGICFYCFQQIITIVFSYSVNSYIVPFFMSFYEIHENGIFRTKVQEAEKYAILVKVYFTPHFFK